MDLDRPEGFVSTYCFTLARVCEESRKTVVKLKIGKLSTDFSEPSGARYPLEPFMGSPPREKG